MKHYTLKYSVAISLIALLALYFCMSCTKTVGKLKPVEETSSYPEAVGNILITKCAVSGCHNSKSKGAAAGLNFETWNSLFEGGNNGAVVISYRPDYSTLLYYTNTYSEYGNLRLSPTMPINSPALGKEEIKVLYDWILAGAPNARGQIRFPDTEPNKKLYVANRGCDLVTIFDSQSKMAMRCVDVGETRGIELPSKLKVAPDNQYWYVCFGAGGFFLKYSVSDNRLVDKLNLGNGNWVNFEISADSKTAYVADANAFGKIATVDLSTMTKTISSGYYYPQGICLDKNQQQLYITSQHGNFIYKSSIKNLSNPEIITLDDSYIPNQSGGLDPHELVFSPDYSEYFVSCQKSNEVRILQTETNKVLAKIPVGKFPQKLCISKSSPYLFVSCTQDSTSFNKQKSRIAIINYSSHTLVKFIYGGFESHAMAVDEENKRVYVANRNLSVNGPLPHHQSLCSGRNGYLTALDLNTLGLVPGFKTEVSNDPFSMDMSH